MSRLPASLQPLWPAVKRGHRWGARAVGAFARRSPMGVSELPRDASTSARATARREPETTTLHIVAPASVVTRSRPAGEPAGHWYFAERLRHETPEQFVLELAGGRILGRHAAVVTGGGLLEVETSHYFDIASWREHPVFWNPRPAEATSLGGSAVVLAARGTGHNYYHFLIDAISRLGMLEVTHPGLRPDAWIVDTATRYQREMLDLLGINESRLVSPAPGATLTADRLLVPSLPNASTLVSPETTTWLRDRLPPRSTEGLPERLYVTRGSTPRTRRLIHEDETVRRLRRHGFEVIDPGRLSVQDQIDHFAAARVVVAPHGAALTNLVFARPGVRVLELFAPGYVNGGYWSITAAVPDSRYRYLIGAGRSARPGRPMRGVMHDVDLAPHQVEAALEQLLSG